MMQAYQKFNFASFVVVSDAQSQSAMRHCRRPKNKRKADARQFCGPVEKNLIEFFSEKYVRILTYCIVTYAYLRSLFNTVNI